MNSFKIGATEFGIGEVEFSMEDGILNLEITGDDTIFEELTEDDDSEWAWALYAPQIYFRDIPYEDKEIVISSEMADNYDIALYMMEHNDFMGKITISDSTVHINGEADIMGKVYTVNINFVNPLS